MFQSKKLTPNPYSMGPSVNARKRIRFGPRNRRAHSQSRLWSANDRRDAAASRRTRCSAGSVVAVARSVGARLSVTILGALLVLEIFVQHLVDVGNDLFGC